MIQDNDKDDNPNDIFFDNLSNTVDSGAHTQSNVSMHLLKCGDNKRQVVFVEKSLGRKTKRRLQYIGVFFLILLILCIFFTFIVIPIIFSCSVELQRLFMFTNWGLHNDESYFKKYELRPGLRNIKVPVNDLNTNETIFLGVWHILPLIYQKNITTYNNVDFEKVLKNSTRSVIMYFHGTGEDRGSTLEKYKILQYFSHIITFDYRSYGDSSKAELSEDAVINDCMQIYKWLTGKTNASIIIWGHSLGSALATRTVAQINSNKNLIQPVGLILESAFTSMSEELYVHPYGKIFSWLPWFKATILRPLEKNGFIFNTKKHILNVECPIMLLSAEDDSIVPYRFGKELTQIAKSRSIDNTTFYYQFPYNLGYDHYFIYKDTFLPYFINYFLFICLEGEMINKKDVNLKLIHKIKKKY